MADGRFADFEQGTYLGLSEADRARALTRVIRSSNRTACVYNRDRTDTRIIT